MFFSLASQTNSHHLDVAGEYIRQNITDEQGGIPLYVDAELIDVSTCEPASGWYMDFWHGKPT